MEDKQKEFEQKGLDEIVINPDEALEFLTIKPHMFSLPNKNAQLLNNLDEYYRKTTQGVQSRSQSGSGSCAQGQASKSSSQKDEVTMHLLEKDDSVPKKRNFDHILLKPKEGQQQLEQRKQLRQRPDVVSKSVTLQPKDGPLYLLKTLKNHKITVLVRRRRNVPYNSRILTFKGKLILFDAHMNLHMQNVEESFRCKIGEHEFVTKTRKKSKIFLRGDNVIAISSGITASKRTHSESNIENIN